MRAIIVIIFIFLFIRSCVGPADAKTVKTVATNDQWEFPTIGFGPALWESAEEVFGIETHYPSAHTFLDGLYVQPTALHLEQIEKYRQRNRDRGPYVRDAKDCDDFAREATYWAKRWGHSNYLGLPASLAYGSAFIRIVGKYPLSSSDAMDSSPTEPGYHVINVYLRNDGVWFFLEPQTGKAEEALSLIYEGVVEVLRIEL